MVKFYGNNSEWVFDNKRGCLLCKFSKGELTTTDEYVIERLTEMGYKREEEAKNEPTQKTTTTTKKTTKVKKG